MSERRRRRRRSDVSTENEEDVVWSGSGASSSGSDYGSEHESEVTDEELSRLNETPATDKEDNGAATPEIQSDTDTKDEKPKEKVKLKEKVNKEDEKKEQADEEDADGEEEEEEEEEKPKEDKEEEDYEEEEDEKSDEENPTHIPKRGMFYQHDDRNYIDPNAGGERGGRRGRVARTDSTGRVWGGKKEPKWAHDMFNEDEQKPKEEWEKQRERRRKREGEFKEHRESEFKEHRPRHQHEGEFKEDRPRHQPPSNNPYIQHNLPEEDNNSSQRTKHPSRETIGRGKRRSSEEQDRVGTVHDQSEGQESYRRADFNPEQDNSRLHDKHSTSRDRGVPERDRVPHKSSERSRDDRGNSRGDQTHGNSRGDQTRGNSRGDQTRGNSRGSSRRSEEYQPQKFDKRDFPRSEREGGRSQHTEYNVSEACEPIYQSSERGRPNSKRRGSSTRQTADRQQTDGSRQDAEHIRSEHRETRDYSNDARDARDYQQWEHAPQQREHAPRIRGSSRRGGTTRDRRGPRNLNYDLSDEDARYEDALEPTKKTTKRGRQNDDEIWKQLEQLKLDQLKLGLDVQRVASQSKTREDGKIVGKGRARHPVHTSPNQNSLIYKIAQEKAQEMATHVYPTDSSPSQSEQEDSSRIAVAIQEDRIAVAIRDDVVPHRPSKPKYKSSTVQTEGEIITVKPKRYSQRSKQVDPNALQEKVRETMSMEDYNSQYASYNGQSDNIYQPFNPYAQEFSVGEQDRQFSEQQMQQMMMIQQMSRSFPQQNNSDYIQLLQQQQLQQQQQAALMAGYIHPQRHLQLSEQESLNSQMMKQRSNKAIPIVDPTTQIHMAPVLHEN